MSPALLVPVVALAVAATAAAALSARVTRSLVALRGELAALAQLRAAHDHLVIDLDRTRRTFDRPTDRPAEVWPSGPGR